MYSLAKSFISVSQPPIFISISAMYTLLAPARFEPRTRVGSWGPRGHPLLAMVTGAITMGVIIMITEIMFIREIHRER